jgi:PAS domain S-box-containing protein
MAPDPAPVETRDPLDAESVTRRRDLAEYLGDMISAHAPDGTYRYVSAAAIELLGYEPSEMVGTWAYDYFHPDDVAKVSAVHRSALEGAPVTVMYRLRRKRGDYIWVETTTRTINHEGTDQVAEILCCTRAVEGRSSIEKLISAGHQAIQERVEDVLRAEAIEPVFQPILELDTGRAIAYEALARFPGDKTRTPDLWFADAWAVGLGVPLELLAVRVAAAALPRLPADVDLTVNASPPTVSSGGFLNCFGGGVDRIAVELTEHLEVDDYAGFSSKLRPLRERGGKVAIDDFGAGYASLRHILKVSPEWIKLDISLTERIHESPVAHALATSLVAFAEDVGVRVIAEGIETDEELEALTEIGFRYGQGFHFGTPGPLDEVLRT